MSRGIDNNNRRKKKAEDDEVEELLRAAEDDVFLKLCLNSHMARGSSTQFIDPDLDQRFRAPKSKFAALKSSLPAYSSSANQQVAEENEEDDDEVEKVIKWAMMLLGLTLHLPLTLMKMKIVRMMSAKRK
uniref:Uncharacterized protein LOC104215240 n=1 Tax=Nicotiana sylvestris TaxID=4096 RepID=A0A1U7VN56_NICSY|nr:PREDICTED: uncharacterized protein LOC104215240 [Nicotiana sylvestris]